MCRGASLGVCCAAGCDAPIRCQDTGGYCDTHNPYDFAWGDEDTEPEPRPERPADDPEKRRIYDLRRVRQGIESTRATIVRSEQNLANLLDRERRLLR